MRATIRHRKLSNRLTARFLTLVCVCCIGFPPVEANAADSRSVRFQHLSRDDGLSQSFAYAIAQDPQGFIWIGTQEGLNRFDGFDFTVFQHDPEDPTSISDESIRALLVDSDGTLWIGSDAGGLSWFDSARGSFHNFTHVADDKTSIASNKVRVIFEDSSGNLWVGTDGSGLDRFDRDSGQFEHFPFDASNPQGLAGAHVWSIAETRDGSLWVGTNGGLSRLDPGASTFRNYRHDESDSSSISGNHVRVLHEDSSGTLWIGTNSAGLNRYSKETDSFERFLHDPERKTSISANRVNTIFEDNAGVLWIGSVGGLNAWDEATESFDRYVHDAANPYSLSHDNVLSIYQDRGNLLWIGTYDGVNLWNSEGRIFLHYHHDSSDLSSLSENTVTSFTENQEGDLFVGTFGGGLNRLNRATGEFSHMRHDPDDSSSLSSDRVMALHIDRNGELWVGTHDMGLNRFNANLELIDRYPHIPGDATSLSSNGVTHILERNNGELWIATFGGGLNVFVPATNTFRHYRADSADSTSLSSDRALILFEDSDQNVWVGTYGGGLNRYVDATQGFVHYAANVDRTDGLGGDEIFMLQEDTNRDLWIGVKSAGLYRWRYADRIAGRESLEKISEIDGLPDATIYSGVFDQSGDLWLSTGRGLSRLNIADMTLRNFNTSHGLQGDEFNLAAGFGARDGTLYFGGMRGFNAFRPIHPTAVRTPLPVAITGVLSLNQPIEFGEALASGDSVSFEHDENLVSFEFAALDFATPIENRFMYRLDGIDADWVDAGTKRDVTYTNLAPGDYQFFVKAANNNGIWSEPPATLRFRVKPAPWQTGWAYLSYVAAALLFLTIWARNLIAQQNTRDRHLHEMRTIQARWSKAQRIGRVANWEYDVRKDRLWLSDEGYRLMNVNPDSFEHTYDGFIERVHPDDRELVHTEMQSIFAGKNSIDADHRFIGTDGTECVVHQRAEVEIGENSTPIRIAGTVSDVTERTRNEEDLRRHASFQKLLANLSADLIVAPSGMLGSHLDKCLEQIADRYRLDAVDIKWIGNSRGHAAWQHRWTRATTDPQVAKLDEGKIPWLIARFRTNDLTKIENVDRLPLGATADRRTLSKLRIRSSLAIPFCTADAFDGFVMFSAVERQRDWPGKTVAELKLIAEQLSSGVERFMAVNEIKELKDQLQDENIYLRDEVRLAHGFDEIIGEDDALRSCLHAVEKVAPTDVTVLILGETGTGKELFAQAIHRLSSRRDGPMISVNCAALPESLIESELFGHEKGAFTGAHQQRKGRFELASGGTLFLDELGELPVQLQAKLLRVIQTGEFQRIGSTKTIHADVRLIVATNRDLRHETNTNSFRADLYYRINTFPIQLPALRERRGDIPLLAKYFVQRHAAEHGKTIDTISTKVLRELESYDWPGNIRELESTIERAVISTGAGSVLSTSGLRHSAAQIDLGLRRTSGESADLLAIERAHIVKVLTQTSWKISGPDGAAAILGVPPSTLRSKMKRCQIQRPAQ